MLDGPAAEPAREPQGRTEQQVRALDAGRAFVDLSLWRKVLASGEDAGGWLDDLLTVDVSGLPKATSRRALFLTPTGRLRADVHVARTPEGFLLLQDPEQPVPIEELLERYVLSSDVSLLDRTGSLALFALPGPERAPDAVSPGVFPLSPSVLGPGTDFVVDAADGARVRTALAGKLEEAELAAVEGWRVRRGVPRFPIDLDQTSHPAEAGLDQFIDHSKGCFPGQEAVAKVRNLGHPPNAVLALRTIALAGPGDPVIADGEEVGRVTSASPSGQETILLCRVRWDARGAKLQTATGETLELLGAPGEAGNPDFRR